MKHSSVTSILARSYLKCFLVSLLVLVSGATADDSDDPDDPTSTTTIRSTLTSTIRTRTTTITLNDYSTTSSSSRSSSATPTTTAENDLTTSARAFQSAVVNRTNFYRSQYLANDVSWDASLAAFALEHAQKCQWQHSNGPYGENLAANFNDVSSAIDAWAGEESEYAYSEAQFSETTGHFTQLVWKNTTRVGCGTTQCHTKDGLQGWYLVCEYEPRGNVVGHFKTMVTKPGMSEDGTLGIGEAARLKGSQALIGMVAALMLVAACR